MIKPSYRTRNRIVQKQFKLLFYNAAKQQIPATNYYNPNQSRSWRRGRSIPAISEARRNEFSTILEGVRWTFSKIILFRAIQMFQEMMEQTKSISSPTRFALTETGNFPNLFRKRTSKWYITGQLWEEAHFLEKRFSLEAIALLIICQIKCLIFGGALMFQTYFQNNGDSVYPVPYNLFRVAWNRNWNFNQWPGENCS